jgi:diguanylate cyclase (GGDEF)-like protein
MTSRVWPSFPPGHPPRLRADLLALLERTTGAFIAGDSAEIHDRIHETLTSLGSMFDVDRAYLFAFSPGLQTMINTHEWCAEGIQPEIDNLQEVPTNIAPWWMAELGARRHISLGSLDEIPDHAVGERAILEPQGIQSLLVVPMSWGDRLDGFAGFDHVRSARRWDDEEIGVLRVIVNCFAQALERGRREARIEELRALAFQDPLTGLANRSLLMDRLRQALARNRRSRRLAALCYLDLDGFKPINDAFGHAAGDAVLVDIAARLRACVRELDTVARVGGDEFVVLLTDFHSSAAIRPVIERLSEAIAEPCDLGTGVTARVRASIGIRFVRDGDVDGDTLLRQADKAMYAAKHGGSGSFRVFDPNVHTAVERWPTLIA